MGTIELATAGLTEARLERDLLAALASVPEDAILQIRIDRHTDAAERVLSARRLRALAPSMNVTVPSTRDRTARPRHRPPSSD